MENNGIKKQRESYFEIKNIEKEYPGVQALDGVSLEVNKNDIIGFAGENGAGKSTLLKIIAGVEPPHSGEMYRNGKLYKPRNFREANLLGVSMVFQEQNLVPNLTVYENLFLSHESNFQQKGFLNRKKMIASAEKHLANFGLDIDPKKEIIKYSFHERQMLEIIRAFVVSEMYNIDTPLILLDEPTAGLQEKERDLLLEKIQNFAERSTIIFVSHRLSELIETCNRITVLKDGKVVSEVDPKTTTEEEIHPMMVGRLLKGDTYNVQEQRELDQEQSDIVLDVSDLGSKNEYESVNLTLKRGEILGIGGLLGSGKKEVGEILYGIGEYDHGKITINDEDVEKPNIRKMIDAKIGYVPSDRKELGIIGTLSVKWNLVLPTLKEISSNRVFVDKKKEKKLVKDGIQKFKIKAHENDFCYALSGGNQQKIVLTKWIMKDLDVLILNNPTRGIDVGAKEEIYMFLREAAKNDLAIILITDDLPELIGLSNLIIIMKDGQIVSKFDAGKDNKPSEEELVQHMV